MLDNITVSDIQAAVVNLRALQRDKDDGKSISQDRLDDEFNDLVDLISQHIFEFGGPNDSRINKMAAGQLRGTHYRVTVIGQTATLEIDAINEGDDRKICALAAPK